MTFDVTKLGRKILGLCFAIVCYFIVHEGAHLIYALCTGTFERIIFMFPGIQVKAHTELLSNSQVFVFCLLGALAALTVAYILCGMRNVIAKIKSNTLRAIFYYLTISLLLCDPIYLSVLCGFFGGGDMNGISLLIPQTLARILFGVIGVINFFIILKVIIPSYKKAFIIHSEH